MMAIVVCALTGCEFQRDNHITIHTSNKVGTKNLSALLTRRGVEHSIYEGVINYHEKFDVEVGEARDRLSSHASAKHDSPVARDFFRAMLQSKNVEYIPDAKDSDQWTIWWPDSQEQKESIEMKNIEYIFSLMEDDGTSCAKTLTSNLLTNRSTRTR
jgi:hypothetical protein